MVELTDSQFAGLLAALGFLVALSAAGLIVQLGRG